MKDRVKVDGMGRSHGVTAIEINTQVVVYILIQSSDSSISPKFNDTLLLVHSAHTEVRSRFFTVSQTIIRTFVLVTLIKSVEMTPN